MMIVMRNTVTRKNAAYIVSAHGFTGPGGDEFWVTGYWGRWDLFEMHRDTAVLRRQEKYHGGCKVDLIETVQKVVTQKLCKGYRIQEEYSTLPKWPICEYGQRWQSYH